MVRTYQDGWSFKNALAEYGKLGGKVSEDSTLILNAVDILGIKGSFNNTYH